MNDEAKLEIMVILPLEGSSVEELRQFRTKINDALNSTNAGSCGEDKVTPNHLEFPCNLSNLDSGLKLLGEYCQEMQPKPKIRVTLYGKDKNPIQIYPKSDLPEYLAGL